MKKNYQKLKLSSSVNDAQGIKEEVKCYPSSPTRRTEYINDKTKKPLSAHDYKVYDLCAQIPPGYFSTYKAISDSIGSCSQAVGNALRRNPFAPLPIPCHRIIKSDYFVGGYDGNIENKLFWKKNRLQAEGLSFDGSGYIAVDMRDSRYFKDFDLSMI
ncbi:hypothetical protein BB561_001744 [Smittium simulii]|uniref:Methylated-DNA--protein-cysteine methyltransferase n=1 Tax=Smittium simulii TaxID=133385 RepID=A0A2T9YT80_9FUNG|nr:hypothetical protein BB561_001744 [Smittium simulii]